MTPGGPTDDDARPPPLAPPPDAHRASHATSPTHPGATLWATQSPALSIWRGDVGLADSLRFDARDGAVFEARLQPPGPLHLGRPKASLPRPPDVGSELFVSSQAASLRHDGRRWWLRRRVECHAQVPVVVGTRVLSPGDEAPLVHATFVQIGRARGAFVDRRFVAPVAPVGAIDPHTGLLARAGLDHEIAALAALGRPATLVVAATHQAATSAAAEPTSDLALHATALAHALHDMAPRAPLMHEPGVVAALLADDAEVERIATTCLALARDLVDGPVSVGTWRLDAQPLVPRDDLPQALAAACSLARRLADRRPPTAPVDLRTATTKHDDDTLLLDPRRTIVLFALEATQALDQIGPHVVPLLERELVATVVHRAPPRARVARVAHGIVAVSLTPGGDHDAFADAVQQAWQGGPPIIDGKLELPRSLCWELHTSPPGARIAELGRECADPMGVLPTLASSLPSPIARRVALAAAAGSAVERVKLLFDVLEGAWRLVATLLAGAYLAGPFDPARPPAGWADFSSLARSLATRHAYPLGTWRDLARIASRALCAASHDDLVGQLARDLSRVRHDGDDSLEQLADQLHPRRNQFAHNVYPEARASRELPQFEKITRDFLRALAPLRAWSLVSIERVDPDPYGDAQTVEYVDHTGAHDTGARRRVGLQTSARVASVVSLVRWREGVVIPLEPLLRRVARGTTFDLFWAQHLPRPGACAFSAVVDGADLTLDVDPRRMPLRLRALADSSAPRPR